MQLSLSASAGPLFRQVYQALRGAILSGTFSAGQKLPSTRDLAEQLGVSRTVVLLAYDQLLAEGFAQGRSGSGTYVSSAVRGIGAQPAHASARLRLTPFGRSAAAAWSRVQVPERRGPSLPYDFAYGRSDLESFPLSLWHRVLVRCARRASIAELDYGPAGGAAALREAISAHLRRSRAVSCDASQVIIVNGSQQALDLVARALIAPGDPVAVEDPCYQGATAVLRAAGARLCRVPVDAQGLDPAFLPDSAQLVFVTPSHQFPTGATLPLTRRLALLEWAKRCRAAVVEDDYDGEFRYEGQPLESLQGLDRGSRVIYIGTFSRTMFSALRIGYLVAPKALVPVFSAAKWLSDRHTPSLEQHALAEFISGGMYERYLRRARRSNAARRRALLDAVQRHLGERVQITCDGAGAHVVLWPKSRIPEETLIARAASRGVSVYGISPYRLKRSSRTGILLGYARLTERQIEEGIRRLARAL
jgi:GntR family transcriptional regulator / MocR family aminotransferase